MEQIVSGSFGAYLSSPMGYFGFGAFLETGIYGHGIGMWDPCRPIATGQLSCMFDPNGPSRKVQPINPV